MVKALVETDLILAFDFDGLITDNPDISDKPLRLHKGCKELLVQLHKDGVRLVLWTCRCGPPLDTALAFLEEEGLLYVFEEINEQVEEIIKKYTPNVGRKLGADAYFDDKNLGASYLKGFTAEGCTIVDWQLIGELVYG